MAINKIDADLEYFKEFVNHGDDKVLSIQKPKENTLLVFLFPAFGIILSFIDLFDFVAVRIGLTAVMVCGTVCTIASDKWFSGNRDRLFLAWLKITGLCITFLIFGVASVYDKSIILIIVFISYHIMIVSMILKDITGRISRRELPNRNGLEARVLWRITPFGLIGIFFIALLIEGNESSLVAVFIVASTMLWSGFERLFRLYYAVIYNINIEVINIWDPPKYGLGEKYQCPLLLGELIEESRCTKINYEIKGMLKRNESKAVKKAQKMTYEEIGEVCKKCKHFPLS